MHTLYNIPTATPARDHTRCTHGTTDLTGYVVAYTHATADAVTFTDIAYVPGATNYTHALNLVYAVIHSVYANGHRPT